MCAKYLFMLCLLAYAAEAQKVFNVKDYGAIQDGNTDNSVVSNYFFLLPYYF